MSHEKQKAVARSSLLIGSIPEQYTEQVLSRALWKEYDRGETIFLQDEEATAIHVVIDGWVKLYRMAPNGSEAIVSVFARGESFGEAVALRRLPYPVSATAVTACTVMHIPTGVFMALIKEEPEICVSILASTFTHLHSLVAQLEQLKAHTGAQRVAEFLLELCDHETESCIVTLPYDKVLIAGRLGMKPESLSRAFGRLKEVGVTIQKNQAEISDVTRLRDYAEIDPAESWGRA